MEPVGETTDNSVQLDDDQQANTGVTQAGRGLRPLLRLWPWVKPYLPQLTTMFVAALIATLAGLALPLLTKDVVDGPIADGDRTGLWWIGLIALGFGLVEASAAWVDLHRRLRPARLERRRRTQRRRHGHPGKFPLLGIGRGQHRDRPT